jgi:hypothetical protein
MSTIYATVENYAIQNDALSKFEGVELEISYKKVSGNKSHA